MSQENVGDRLGDVRAVLNQSNLGSGRSSATSVATASAKAQAKLLPGCGVLPMTPTPSGSRMHLRESKTRGGSPWPRTRLAPPPPSPPRGAEARPVARHRVAGRARRSCPRSPTPTSTGRTRQRARSAAPTSTAPASSRASSPAPRPDRRRGRRRSRLLGE